MLCTALCDPVIQYSTPSFEKSVDSDKLVSNEASESESKLFHPHDFRLIMKFDHLIDWRSETHFKRVFLSTHMF